MAYSSDSGSVNETEGVGRTGTRRSNIFGYSAGAHRVSAGLQLWAFAPRGILPGIGPGAVRPLLRRGDTYGDRASRRFVFLARSARAIACFLALPSRAGLLGPPPAHALSDIGRDRSGGYYRLLFRGLLRDGGTLAMGCRHQSGAGRSAV